MTIHRNKVIICYFCRDHTTKSFVQFNLISSRMNVNFAVAFKAHHNDKAVMFHEIAVEWGSGINDMYREIFC